MQQLQQLQQYIEDNFLGGLRNNLLEVITLSEDLTLDCLDFCQQGFDLENKPENLEKAIKFVKTVI